MQLDERNPRARGSIRRRHRWAWRWRRASRLFTSFSIGRKSSTVLPGSGKLCAIPSKMAEKEKEASSLEIKPYDADGKSILRIKIIEKGKAIGCVDAYQSGDEMYLRHFHRRAGDMPKLLAAPKEGAEKDILSAVVDLGKSIEAAAAIPDSGLSDMPADLRKNLTESLRGRKVKLSLSNHYGAATVDLTVDREILKIIRKFGSRSK